MRKKVIKYCVPVVVLAAFLLVILLPVISMIGTAFKDGGEILTSNSIFPKNPTVENFAKIFVTTNFGNYIKNSVVIAVSVTLISTTFAAMAGYIIARYQGRYRFFRVYARFLLILQMFPAMLLLIPLYSTFTKLNMTGSRFSVILLYSAFQIPFSVWLLQSFFAGAPIEVEESGLIDGCTSFQVFYKLIVPISSPGIASAAIFNFIYCWNEYTFANVFLKNDNIRTLPVGLSYFIQQFTAEWGSLMAASTLAVVPVAFFLIFMQKYVIQGLTAGAVKG